MKCERCQDTGRYSTPLDGYGDEPTICGCEAGRRQPPDPRDAEIERLKAEHADVAVMFDRFVKSHADACARAEKAEAERFQAIAHYSKQAADAQTLQRNAERERDAISQQAVEATERAEKAEWERDEAVAWQNAKAEWIEIAERTLKSLKLTVHRLEDDRDAAIARAEKAEAQLRRYVDAEGAATEAAIRANAEALDMQQQRDAARAALDEMREALSTFLNAPRDTDAVIEAHAVLAKYPKAK